MMENLYNLNIERAVLSSLIFEAYTHESDTIVSSMDATDLYIPFHQKVFAVVVELMRDEKPVDEEFIRGALTRDDVYDEVAMLDILSARPISNTKAYVQQIVEMSQKRKLLNIATQIKKEIIEYNVGALDAVEKSIKRIERVAESGSVTIARKTIGYAKESEPEFICQDWLPIPLGTTSMVVAPGGTGKTWFALQLAIRAAREDAGRKVFLWLSEDPEGIVRNRYDAVIDKVLIGQRGTEDAQITISTEDPLLLLESHGRAVSLSPKFYAMRRELREFDVIVIDPLLAFFGGDENDNSQARVFMQAFLNWARAENKSIVFLHHSRKGDSNGSSRARGAGAIIDAVRCVYDMDFIYIKKSDGREKDAVNLHNREFHLTKDNYGAAKYMDAFKVVRHITPERSARGIEIEYEMDSVHGSMPTI